MRKLNCFYFIRIVGATTGIMTESFTISLMHVEHCTSIFIFIELKIISSTIIYIGAKYSVRYNSALSNCLQFYSLLITLLR